MAGKSAQVGYSLLMAYSAAVSGSLCQGKAQRDLKAYAS
jgi:hypothetical protein